MLTEKDVIEFQEICKAECGIDLSKEEALKEGLKLIELTKIAIGLCDENAETSNLINK